jgi:hypothetical protein
VRRVEWKGVVKKMLIACRLDMWEKSLRVGKWCGCAGVLVESGRKVFIPKHILK